MTNSAAKILVKRDELIETLEITSRPLVFTNGCFDILHRGHITYLEQAAGLGSTLLVAVNSDQSVKRLNKDKLRPFNHLEDRMHLLAALACVDLVVPFNEDTPLELIKLVQPDHLVKGGDWPLDKIVGSDFVTSKGGQVHAIPFQFERSTTVLIDRIRSGVET